MQERIKIQHDGKRGWATIAKSAFDPSKHKLYHDAAPKPPAPKPPAPKKAQTEKDE